MVKVKLLFCSVLIVASFLLFGCKKPYVGKYLPMLNKCYINEYAYPCHEKTNSFDIEYTVKSNGSNKYTMSMTAKWRGKVALTQIERGEFYLMLFNDDVVVDRIAFSSGMLSMTGPISITREFETDIVFDATYMDYYLMLRE